MAIAIVNLEHQRKVARRAKWRRIGQRIELGSIQQLVERKSHAIEGHRSANWQSNYRKCQRVPFRINRRYKSKRRLCRSLLHRGCLPGQIWADGVAMVVRHCNDVARSVCRRDTCKNARRRR